MGVHETVIEEIYNRTKENMKTVKKDLIKMLAKYEKSFEEVIYDEVQKKLDDNKRE